MKTAFILKEKTKRPFDVKNKKDMTIFKNFLVNNGWGSEGCPFALEHPHISIPHMIQEKIVRHTLGIKC